MSNQEKCIINDVEYQFKLNRISAERISLKCNDWHILEITEDGLTRSAGAHLKAPFMKDDMLKWRTNHAHMKEKQTTGKLDVQLRLFVHGREIYIDAVTKEWTEHLLYIDSGGLYLWIADRHNNACYASSKDRTILVKE